MTQRGRATLFQNATLPMRTVAFPSVSTKTGSGPPRPSENGSPRAATRRAAAARPRTSSTDRLPRRLRRSRATAPRRDSPGEAARGRPLGRSRPGDAPQERRRRAHPRDSSESPRQSVPVQPADLVRASPGSQTVLGSSPRSPRRARHVRAPVLLYETRGEANAVDRRRFHGPSGEVRRGGRLPSTRTTSSSSSRTAGDPTAGFRGDRRRGSRVRLPCRRHGGVGSRRRSGRLEAVRPRRRGPRGPRVKFSRHREPRVPRLHADAACDVLLALRAPPAAQLLFRRIGGCSSSASIPTVAAEGRSRLRRTGGSTSPSSKCRERPRCLDRHPDLHHPPFTNVSPRYLVFESREVRERFVPRFLGCRKVAAVCPGTCTLTSASFTKACSSS